MDEPLGPDSFGGCDYPLDREEFDRDASNTRRPVNLNDATTYDELLEHLLAVPHEESRYGACGGVPPRRGRGSMWWWVYVANELRPIRCH